ncbi:MAG: hypothetical protein H0X01_07160, partial [Nitrospira sp.]|nr:hypothetical protein [Nitrospira sp.]
MVFQLSMNLKSLFWLNLWRSKSRALLQLPMLDWVELLIERSEMGGTNPYIEKADVELPTKPYTVTFVKPDKTQQVVQVNPDKIPYGPTGLPGSILDIAMGAEIDLE